MSTTTVDQDLEREDRPEHADALEQAREATETSAGVAMGEKADAAAPEEGVGRKPSERDRGSSGETAGDGLFDRAQYDDPKLRLPKVDGQDVDKIAVAFSGRVMLDRKDPNDVALIRRLALGKDVTMQVEARTSGKKHGFTTNKEGDLDAVVLTATAKVETVYIPTPEELDA
jgi:hypothetical protein